MRLSLQAVTHRYPGATGPVLDGVDLEVEHGEFLAIFGPSGSGKTTLLSLLGGLLSPDQGRIVFGDPEGRHADPTASCSWVLQTTNMLPERTTLDNAALGAFADGCGWFHAALIAEARLRAVGLGDRVHHKARLLSGGEVQRLSVARALSSARPVILADEPTGQLDLRSTERVLSVLLDHRHRRTVVVVTHDEQVAGLCDRVVMVGDGRLRPAVDRPPA